MRFRRAKSTVYFLAAALLANPALAAMPRYQVTDKGLILEGVSSQCPMIYDNDWWTDVPDAAFIWAKASLDKCKLRGNIITRCTFGWEKGYAHKMEEQIQDCQKLLKACASQRAAQYSGPSPGSGRSPSPSGQRQDRRNEIQTQQRKRPHRGGGAQGLAGETAAGFRRRFVYRRWPRPISPSRGLPTA